jgi:hypothetical protein
VGDSLAVEDGEGTGDPVWDGLGVMETSLVGEGVEVLEAVGV